MKSKRKQSAANSTPPSTISPGVIHPTEIYTKAEFLQRVGWNEDAWRTAKRNGLKFTEAQRRVYIVGSWFLDYLDKIARPPASAG